MEIPVKAVESNKTNSLPKKANSESMSCKPEKVAKMSPDQSDETTKSNSSEAPVKSKEMIQESQSKLSGQTPPI